MQNLILGFIGAGNMTTAILNGVLNKRLIPPDHVWLSNRSEGKLAPFQVRGVHTTTENEAVARYADIVVLAVKPQMFDDVLPGIASLMHGKCLVSIAAGISVSYLERVLPGAQVVRAMPNTPLLVGSGATAVAEAPQVPKQLFETILDLFAAAGEVAVIQENQMDDIINVNGSTPAFFFRMADALVKRAESMGIDSALALLLVARTMEGSARLLLETGKTPEELTKQVCSPGGTTLAALSAFDQLDFDGLMGEATRRCTARSKELGR